MSKNLIEAKFFELIGKNAMFTSVDVGNAIKEEGDWVSNSDVAEWLRTNATIIAQNYIVTNIPVLGGAKTARLYHPLGTNADDYQNRDQTALPPMPQHNMSKTPAPVSTGIPSPVTKKRKIRADGEGRLRIPTSFVRKMGLNPGDSVDPSTILANNVSKKLKVHADGRISFSRKCLPWSDGPVVISIDVNHNLCFEKP